MKKSARVPLPRPPAHLSRAARKWWAGVAATYRLEDHQLLILTSAADAWDRSEDARAALATHGITYIDRFGTRKNAPEITTELKNRASYAQLIAQLDLQVSPPSAPAASLGGLRLSEKGAPR